MTTSTQQAAIQAWLDTLNTVERHRVCRALNWCVWHEQWMLSYGWYWYTAPKEYDVVTLEEIRCKIRIMNF